MSDLNNGPLTKFDSQKMLDRVLHFPDQVQQAKERAESFELKLAPSQISNVCITGMGGSAIGGDIVHALLAEQLRIPVFVNRDYTLPEFIDHNSLVFVSSYSGNTEETLSAYDRARQKTAHIVGITSGGVLTEKALSHGYPVFTIPAGFQPRAALGYMSISLLYGFYYAGLIENPETAILETVAVLGKLKEAYHPTREDNPAIELSRKLFGKIPLIYASATRFAPVAQRWKGQFSENSKVLAFANAFPELNHNEIVGWGPCTVLNKTFQVIFLKDKADHEQIKKRMEITKEIIENHSSAVLEVESTGDSLLARLFSLIFLGDMSSLYLAAMNKVDPTPVKNIDYLKSRM
ncbi:MAG: bifunctional phosphoglucose/phosphomannose isomerase [bacterium]